MNGKTKQLQLKWKSSILSVILIGAGLPFFGAQAGTLRCSRLYRPGVESAYKPATAKWARLKSTQEQVDYIVSTFTKGATDFYLAIDFAKQILSLPEDGQQQWMKAIGQAYRKVPKKDPNPLASWHIGGRRLLDHALTLLVDSQGLFRLAINEKGESARDAYRSYMQRQSELFGSGYDAKAVEVVISVLQNQLRALQKQGGAPLSILISGSFPNGKADLLTSDVDLSVSDGGLMKWQPDWQSEVNKALHQAGLQTNLEVAFSTESERFYGKINPIIFRVTTEEVRLMVFPPGTMVQSQTDLYAGDPDIYPF